MTEHVSESTALYRAIHAQPQAIRAILTDWDGPTQVAQRLSQCKRVFLSGIGTSYHAAIVGEYLLRRAGIDAWAVRSYEFTTYPRPLRADDGVIVISHRGSKLHGIGAIQQAKQAGVFTVGITGKDSKMQGADIVLETVEQEVSSTHSISYISTLIRLAQIAARLAPSFGNAQVAQKLEHDLIALPALMEQIFQYEDALQKIARDIATNQRRVLVVGAGPNAATATEGALKAKEAAYITIEGLELEQAIHGPLVAFEPHDLIIVISVEGPSQPRIADFLRALNEIDTHVLLLGTAPTPDTAELFPRAEWQQIALLPDGEILEELSPLLTVVPLQLLADFLATALSTNADSFRKEQEAYRRATEQYTL